MKEPENKEAYEGRSKSKSHLKKDVKKDKEVIYIPIRGPEVVEAEKGVTDEPPQGNEGTKAEDMVAQEPQRTEKEDAPEEDKDILIKELKENNLRLLADFENFRRRKEEEVSHSRKYASEEIIKQFLGILDNFDRALATVESSHNLESFVTGIQMIHKQMRDVMHKEGVMEIKARGEHFDPSLHQAVAMVEDDELPDETIVDELQKGYKLKEKVIRPSMVRVSRKS
jgi:molecular chaperone GrpE